MPANPVSSSWNGPIADKSLWLSKLLDLQLSRSGPYALLRPQAVTCARQRMADEIVITYRAEQAEEQLQPGDQGRLGGIFLAL